MGEGYWDTTGSYVTAERNPGKIVPMRFSIPERAGVGAVISSGVSEERAELAEALMTIVRVCDPSRSSESWRTLCDQLKLGTPLKLEIEARFSRLY